MWGQTQRPGQPVILGPLLLVLALAAPAWPSSPEPLTPARRVVLYEAYELAAALQAWDRVAGLSTYAKENDLMQRLLPHLQEMPAPGSGFVLNVEALLALKTDLVVTWSRKPEALEFLRRQGIKVLAIYPESIADLLEVLDRLGQVFDCGARAAEVGAVMRQSLGAVEQYRRERRAGVPAPRVVWLWGKPTTINGNRGVTADLIRIAGGRNLGEHLDDLNREISMEEMMALDPEVVLIWGSAVYSPETLYNDPKWQSVSAVKNRRIVKLPRQSTWSPRVVDLAWLMLQTFYPGVLPPAEVAARLDAYYRAVFGIPWPGWTP